MHIRMLRNTPCSVAYGGFKYRVEPVRTPDTHESYISARLLTSAGELWEPLQEQVLTPRFNDENAAERAWTQGFETKDNYFLLRALVNRLIDDGYAVELEQDAPAK